MCLIIFYSLKQTSARLFIINFKELPKFEKLKQTFLAQNFNTCPCALLIFVQNGRVNTNIRGNFQPFEFVMERRQIDAEQLGGACLMTARAFECRLDQVNFKMPHLVRQIDAAPDIDRADGFERFDLFDERERDLF